VNGVNLFKCMQKGSGKGFEEQKRKQSSANVPFVETGREESSKACGMQSLSQLCILSNPSLLQFQLQLPAALHEMLGSVDSHVPAPSEPAEHGPSDWPSVEQIHSHIDHSPSGALVQLRDSLFECAQAVSQNDWGKAQQLLGVLRTRLTAPGDSFERVSSYFTAALATRISRATGTQVRSLELTL
jgi:hypothetical protein